LWVNKKFILKKFLVGIFFKIQNSQSHIERIEVFYVVLPLFINVRLKTLRFWWVTKTREEEKWVNNDDNNKKKCDA